MWLFNSTKSLVGSGMFKGFTDWHSHILPGVDDGIKTLEDSLEVLKAYEELGFKKLWLTPHTMEDYPNTKAELTERFEELTSHWNGNLELRLASEYMLDNLFDKRLEENDLLPIGEDGSHLLVETSYYTPPFGMDDKLENIRKAGFYPLLAHPERYRYMETDDYKKLRDEGVHFQMNFLSLVGGYGETARKKAEWLLANDMVDVLGSDLHRLQPMLSSIKLSPKKAKHLKAINEVVASKNHL